ncbi:MAG: thiol:disulfide interchange protein DsbG [Marinospirillum sp.]|uniref:thiol:disulfide interchange protein DsbG n=1 Tax=Marinospirillum sp. TaxID=2183934 RepID=UPI0019E8F6DD|nr:thiol:disulfide interchange protein DsbG [Marinospirillum sp.]MBE0507684.1 thiol:disulfide interchange protein DsbG [Marinospirillum sp.]
MFSFRFLCSAALGITLLSSFSLQANTPGSSLQQVEQTSVMQLPEPIQHLQNQGLNIVREFPVGASLKGWVVNFEGRDLVVYTTLDGEFLLNGVLLDAQGKDLTQEHQNTWLPKPGWDDLQNSHYITETSQQEQGDSKTIYMFFDPNCPFCHLAWLALQPYRLQGLEVRWIPVAYIKPDSRNRAAALLSAAPEQQAVLLQKNMETFGQPLPELDKAPDARTREQLQANMDLMQSMGINGTPGWVWQDAEGEMQTHTGMLRLPRLPEITGLPAQEHPEPVLMRFR